MTVGVLLQGPAGKHAGVSQNPNNEGQQDRSSPSKSTVMLSPGQLC